MTLPRNQRRRDRALMVIRGAKSNPCSRCGHSGHWTTMVFYHDKGPKNFRISPSCGRSASAIEAEIAKCSLYCTECFAQTTYENADHMLGVKPRRVKVPGAPETLTEMLRRSAQLVDARERRRRRLGGIGYDRNGYFANDPHELSGGLDPTTDPKLLALDKTPPPVRIEGDDEESST